MSPAAKTTAKSTKATGAPAEQKPDATVDDAGAQVSEDATVPGTAGAQLTDEAFVPEPQPIAGAVGHPELMSKLPKYYEGSDGGKAVTIVGDTYEEFFQPGAVKTKTKRLRFRDGRVTTKAEAEAAGANYTE